MKLSKFKFNLPEELIALEPTKFRDESRMMVVHRRTGEIEHRVFKDILEYFDKGDTFVFNNTRVFPARLYGNKEKTGAQIEVFLLRELNERLKLWDVLVDPARKIRIGNKLYFGNDEELVAEVIDNTTSRGRTLRFLYDGSHDEFKELLFQLGQTPLPKYIDRDVNKEDPERYQSIFAEVEGAVVAPAASLHFSRELMKRLEIKDCHFSYITVHHALGAYRDIDVEDLTKHKMDSEEMYITEESCININRAWDEEKKICAVGTSILRALETAVSTDGHLKPFEGWTNRFIFPPYEFHLPSALVTNFHMPLSTLLMMTAAFGGHELIMSTYDLAVKEKYRFGAYGDAMLIID
ncbi:tRNA preQ1(34) S-adenosylmethionine ribosyltransferase-isomerase QueA [Porphyromonas gingivalis]|uniref:tRNA preQ1(34) S-adenosylmethionine ribosyltransferase-isomerase QueA n=1 Tax=Porphyromonas gingivalis TaxID=837 RepID=UPI00097CDC14|nr:tRNA preQ1(34) S-adenosylmethionine ribosyltransferase-isomerase QueA [Porphyromonas gingivalis]SJM20610.1 tRNA preQ1(34) S-adenosylmethionine ribosyltransferase-isomerase QueA [Porphyromonas gingivalis]